jgi:hypothetical protein
MKKVKAFFFDFFLVFLFTIPAFVSLLNSYYFTIHDNQHIVRLHLLDTGIKQGYLYPRWVDRLTFGFGDPLFNFYPPLVYYLGEFFHLLGFSYIWSIKLVFICGFVVGAFGMYLLARQFLGRLAGFLAAVIFTYSFYHIVNAYVRGALSEFFAMNLLPFVFLYFYKIKAEKNLSNVLFFGIFLALIFLTHQLVALPLIFFLFFFFIYCFITASNKLVFIKRITLGFVFGLGLSAFYWLPMLYERQFIFLSKGLGNPKDHFLYPYQFWYSSWGFGASIKGPVDGMTFQLGKIPILLVALSIVSFFIFQLRKLSKKDNEVINQFIFFLFLMVFGLWMTTASSSIIWNNIKLLWNLQFPWRFLSVTVIFISLVSVHFIYFLQRIFEKLTFKRLIIFALSFSFIGLTIVKYSQYSRPQSYLKVSDKDLLTDEEILWRQSRTVLHFVPQGVKAKKNEYGVYVLDIEKKDLPKNIFEIKKGDVQVKILTNKFQQKEFLVKAKTPVIFQLNTFHFRGWTAYLNKKKLLIDDNNPYKLITVKIPVGEHTVKFIFEDTVVRKIGNLTSLFTLIVYIFLFVKFKKYAQ